MTPSILHFIPCGGVVILMVLAAVLVLKILAKPMKLLMKLLLNAAIGFILLFAVNFVGGFIGLHITITWINALIAGVFGVPGVIAIVFYTIFL